MLNKMKIIALSCLPIIAYGQEQYNVTGMPVSTGRKDPFRTQQTTATQQENEIDVKAIVITGNTRMAVIRFAGSNKNFFVKENDSLTFVPSKNKRTNEQVTLIVKEISKTALIVVRSDQQNHAITVR